MSTFFMIIGYLYQVVLLTTFHILAFCFGFLFPYPSPLDPLAPPRIVLLHLFENKTKIINDRLFSSTMYSFPSTFLC